MLRLKIWTVKSWFKIFYSTYYYPFETGNEKYARLSEPEKLEYLAECSRWYRSKARKIEHQETIRTFYSDMAMKDPDIIMMNAHRLVLLWFREYEKRLKEFDQTYKSLTK